MQVKTIMRYHYTPTRTARPRKTDNIPSAGDDTQKLENANISVSKCNAKCYGLFGKQPVVS